MERLHPDRLAALAPGIQTPGYDRTGLGCGIVHLGLGSFHRAHQALYTEDAIEAAGGDWGIIGVSLRSDSVAAQLRPQDCLYSLLSEDGSSHQLRVVGAVRDVLVAPQQPQRVIATIAAPGTALVTLTITEKGYYLAHDGVSLDADAAAMAADLRRPGQPATAIGILALGLRERMASCAAPITLLSCDNLAGNSRKLAVVLRQYLERTFPAVIPWLDTAVTFPCSMVDRIVPAMTDQGRVRQAALLGLSDAGAVATEPFHQWIIEDRFAGPRPAWEAAGAQLVANIDPFENIKLRLLNASHTAIACIGLLARLETVDQVMAQASLADFVRRLMTLDLMPALVAPPGFDLTAYRDQLLRRFSNPRLGHRCAQIAMDSSEKIAQRWLPGLASGRQQPLLAAALAAWCYLVLEGDCDIDDPRASQLLSLRASVGNKRERVSAVLGCARIDADSVATFDVLLQQIRHNMNIIANEGLEALLAT